MKSITIHGLDDEMDEQIRNRAGAAGLSLNKTIKLLLQDVWSTFGSQEGI